VIISRLSSYTLKHCLTSGTGRLSTLIVHKLTCNLRILRYFGVVSVESNTVFNQACSSSAVSKCTFLYSVCLHYDMHSSNDAVFVCIRHCPRAFCVVLSVCVSMLNVC